jgi:hypothetical protein
MSLIDHGLIFSLPHKRRHIPDRGALMVSRRSD